MASAHALPGERHEGHHVDHPEAGMGAGVRSEVERARSAAVASARGASSPTSVNTARWWSGSVCRSSRSRPAALVSWRQIARVPALADVDDALEHPASLASRVTRCRRCGAGWYGGPVNLGAPELIIVLVVILVLFGGAKLPKLARSLGQAQSEFKKGVQATDDEDAEGDKPTA